MEKSKSKGSGRKLLTITLMINLLIVTQVLLLMLSSMLAPLVALQMLGLKGFMSNIHQAMTHHLVG